MVRIDVTGIRLFVGNLPSDATEEEIGHVFGKFGTIVSVCLLGNNKSRSGNSCAFVNFETQDAANAAIKALDGARQLREGTETPPMQVRIARSTNTGNSSMNNPILSAGLPAAAMLPRKRSFSENFPAVVPTAAAQPPGEGGFIKFFVGCLPAATSKQQLLEVFEAQGFPVKPDDGVHLMPGRGQSGQACAFVHVAENVSHHVVERLNGKVAVGDCVINVRVANNQKRAAKPIMVGRAPADSFFSSFLPNPNQSNVNSSFYGSAFGGYGDLPAQYGYVSSYGRPANVANGANISNGGYRKMN
jgi:RNA recognition motif-containing protein